MAGYHPILISTAWLVFKLLQRLSFIKPLGLIGPSFPSWGKCKMVGRHRIERCFRGFTDQTRCQPLPRPFIQSLLDNQPPLAVIVILPYSAQRLCNKDLTMLNLEVFTSFLQPVNSRLYPKKFATLFRPELFEESNLSFPTIGAVHPLHYQYRHF